MKTTRWFSSARPLKSRNWFAFLSLSNKLVSSITEPDFKLPPVKSQKYKIMKNKKAQEEKITNFPKLTSKRAQEEIVGFALIIIIVSIVIVSFLAFSLSKPQKDMVESYEVQSFIQSVLQYTTDCEETYYDLEYFSVQDLIFECLEENTCNNEIDSCVVLNTTLQEILDVSWDVGADFPTKGYELKINAMEESDTSGGNTDSVFAETSDSEIIFLSKGNSTNQYKGSSQDFVKSGDSIEISFKAYY